jgi:Fe-S cluster assembly scaffold protein SufB
MKTLEITDAYIRINESCHIIDRGLVDIANIVIGEGLQVEYCFVMSHSKPPCPATIRRDIPPVMGETETSDVRSSPSRGGAAGGGVSGGTYRGGAEVTGVSKYSRHIAIGAHSTFTGTGIMMDRIDIEIITEVMWDHVSSTLDLVALATDQSQISIEWVVRVDSPYRQVSTRVDQTNILIGTGARVRWVPRLEIATDDIEWGHSCRIHRLGGESLFYLTSRGLTHESAETLLLESEIARHLRTVEGERQEMMRGEVEERVKLVRR